MDVQHTIILDDIPVLPLNAKNEARRLITLLDALCTLPLDCCKLRADLVDRADETKTRLLAFAAAPIDSLFFPDAVNAPPPPEESAADDLPTSFSESHGSQAPGSSGPVHVLDAETFSLPLNSSISSAQARASTHYDGHEVAGEVSDSLVEEMLGDVQQDLDAPYRPNISTYEETARVAAYERDAARALDRAEKEEQLRRQLRRRLEQEARAPIHPSAATPSFQNLAIFTGECERAHPPSTARADTSSRRRGRTLLVQARRLARARDVLRRVPRHGSTPAPPCARSQLGDPLGCCDGSHDRRSLARSSRRRREGASPIWPRRSPLGRARAVRPQGQVA